MNCYCFILHKSKLKSFAFWSVCHYSLKKKKNIFFYESLVPNKKNVILTSVWFALVNIALALRKKEGTIKFEITWKFLG